MKSKDMDPFCFKQRGSVLVNFAKEPETFSGSPWILFDLDHTLITSKSGKTFITKKEDITLFSNTVVSCLRKFRKNKINTGIVSNQKNLSGQKLEIFKEKIAYLFKKLRFDMPVVAPTQSDSFRKPMTGTKSFFGKIFLYVGDAAGRPGDFSNSDLLFAENLGVKFLTPDQLFLDKKEEISLIQPKRGNLPDLSFLKDPEPTLIILIGPPGSGKSTFRTRYIPENYSVISNDANKKTFTGTGKYFVVDNTNPSRATRESYVTKAKQRGITRVIYFEMDQTIEFCKTSVQKREFVTGKHIPSIAFSVYKKNYQEPSPEETNLIFKIPFSIN